MIWIANALVALVAALHVYFLVLEMFLWTKPLGLKTFRNSPEKAADSAVLAANQGLYNGFLAAGLVWGLVQGTPGFGFQSFVPPFGPALPNAFSHTSGQRRRSTGKIH